MASGRVALGVDDARLAQQGERPRRGTTVVWDGARRGRDHAAEHRQAAAEGIAEALTEALTGFLGPSGASTGCAGRLPSSSAQPLPQPLPQQRAAVLGADSEEKIMTDGRGDGKKLAAVSDSALPTSTTTTTTATTATTTAAAAATKEVRSLDVISHVLQSCGEKALLEALRESGTRDRRPLRLVLTALLQALEQARTALDRAAVS